MTVGSPRQEEFSDRSYLTDGGGGSGLASGTGAGTTYGLPEAGAVTPAAGAVPLQQGDPQQPEVQQPEVQQGEPQQAEPQQQSSQQQNRFSRNSISGRR